MQPYKTDVAVLLIFFVRSDTLQKVFDSIKKAKPRTLLLWQDGPRENRPEDMEKILACRKIVEQIDWECEIHKCYHEKNMGCDPSTFLAQKWAFSIVDKCIIMEDDRIPCDSFYSYCEELLNKYENDTRINHICGTNLLGDNIRCKDDYFFAPFGSTTWATWKRVADEWDEQYSFLQNNEYYLARLKEYIGKARFNNCYKTALWHRDTGKQYWETILGMGCMLNNRLAIIPKKNMVCDIGMTENATHAIANKKLISKKHLAMFDMAVHDVTFPMKHPSYMLPDMQYVAEINKIAGIGHPALRLSRKIAYAVRCVIYGEAGRLFKKFGRKK